MGGVEADNDIEDATMMLVNSVVANNTSTSNGGGLFIYNTTTQITDSQIAANQAQFSGGGLYQESTPSHQQGYVVVLDSEIVSNTATQWRRLLQQ